MKKDNAPFSCFYDFAVCKECGLVYFCIPSIKKLNTYLNVPKKCKECEKEIKRPKRWKKCGFTINDKNYPKVIGRRLLIDTEPQDFRIETFVDSKEHLEKCWGKKIVKKIFKQK